MSANGESSLDEIENAAATWLLRQDSQAWSAVDQRALEEWLQASPHHRVAYIRLRSVWKQTPHLRRVSPAPHQQVDAAGFESVKPRRASVGAWAAAALVSIGLGFAILGAHFLARNRTFETPIGGLATVPTEDGSLITLNTDTRIDIQMDAQERRIALQRGEAFFEVANDEHRPFIVEAGRHAVIAVGTKFSVRVVSGALYVAVTEGKVRLEPQEQTLEEAAPTALPALSAGTIATIRQHEIDVKEEAVANIEQALSWRSGYVVLRNTSIAAAAVEFNRYNTRQLVIVDPAIDDITVGGNFRSNNIDGFVRLLERGFGIEAEVQGNQILLRRRPQ